MSAYGPYYIQQGFEWREEDSAYVFNRCRDSAFFKIRPGIFFDTRTSTVSCTLCSTEIINIREFTVPSYTILPLNYLENVYLKYSVYVTTALNYVLVTELESVSVIYSPDGPVWSHIATVTTNRFNFWGCGGGFLTVAKSFICNTMYISTVLTVNKVNSTGDFTGNASVVNYSASSMTYIYAVNAVQTTLTTSVEGQKIRFDDVRVDKLSEWKDSQYFVPKYSGVYLITLNVVSEQTTLPATPVTMGFLISKITGASYSDLGLLKAYYFPVQSHPGSTYINGFNMEYKGSFTANATYAFVGRTPFTNYAIGKKNDSGEGDNAFISIVRLPIHT